MEGTPSSNANQRDVTNFGVPYFEKDPFNLLKNLPWEHGHGQQIVLHTCLRSVKLGPRKKLLLVFPLALP